MDFCPALVHSVSLNVNDEIMVSLFVCEKRVRESPGAQGNLDSLFFFFKYYIRVLLAENDDEVDNIHIKK
jgi:hypothetical protein